MEGINTEIKNPGPCWGYAFLRGADRYLPGPMFSVALRAGAVVGWALMPTRRNHQKEYWMALTGHNPTWAEQWRHFGAFAETLMGKLALDRGEKPQFCSATDCNAEAYIDFCRSGRAGLFGTFHIAESDLMGSMLSSFGRQIHMVRLRVGNALDLDVLERSFDGMVKFIFVNQPEEMMFAIKQAIESGHSIALQCDRHQYGSKQEAFHFLGKMRLFPFTIYHLAALFRLPIAFSFALKRTPSGEIPAYMADIFEPIGTRAEVLAAGRIHFQTVLDKVEEILREDPTLWLNFEPLNPEVAE